MAELLDPETAIIEAETHIENIPVLYRRLHDDWDGAVEQVLKRAAKYGWLDGLNRVEVGRSMGGANARYMPDGPAIQLSKHGFYPGRPGSRYLVGNTSAYAVLHELVHHVHIARLFDWEDLDTVDKWRHRVWSHRFNQREELTEEEAKILSAEVSEYAPATYLEVVSETACGILMGETYSDEVMAIYERFDGPDLTGMEGAFIDICVKERERKSKFEAWWSKKLSNIEEGVATSVTGDIKRKV